jgi:glyoxylase-like metal-dependent hydrolase (beta-lactamase superfamily II)
MGVLPNAILITHGHSDHIAGNAALKQRWPDCPIVVGKAEAAKLIDPDLNLSAMFGLPMVSPAADATVSDGDTYEAAGMCIKVLEIPGHSAGHVVYQIEGAQPAIVFVGDVIFAGSVGRTDFPDGDFDRLAQGIRDKLFTLPDETILYPGHGPSTTVGREKRSNPFVRE